MRLCSSRSAYRAPDTKKATKKRCILCSKIIQTKQYLIMICMMKINMKKIKKQNINDSLQISQWLIHS